jgi:predicted nucleotide-binding protein
MLEVSVPIAHELLAQCIKQGQALVQRASLVGDFSDYEAWKSARKQWIDPTVQALEHMYGSPREAREFNDTVESRESGLRWQQQYAADLDCVKGAIELLSLLQGELAFDTSASDPRAPGAEEQLQAAQRTGQAERATEQGAPTVEPDAAGTIDAQRIDERDRERTAHVEERLADATPASAGERERSPADARTIGSELARAEAVGSELTAHDATAPVEHRDAHEGASVRTRRVFVAHGRDERWKEAVAHVLEQAGSEEVTILNDHPEERARLIEHIGEQAEGPRYAIVLLTADDIGAARLESTEEPYFTTRARQGVVFEMGFLVAALTPRRVCVLYEDGVELPCELDGISHVRLDLAGTWQPKLLLALRRAGFDYDLNRLAPA